MRLPTHVSVRLAARPCRGIFRSVKLLWWSLQEVRNRVPKWALCSAGTCGCFMLQSTRTCLIPSQNSHSVQPCAGPCTLRSAWSQFLSVERWLTKRCAWRWRVATWHSAEVQIASSELSDVVLGHVLGQVTRGKGNYHCQQIHAMHVSFHGPALGFAKSYMRQQLQCFKERSMHMGFLCIRLILLYSTVCRHASAIRPAKCRPLHDMPAT